MCTPSLKFYAHRTSEVVTDATGEKQEDSLVGGGEVSAGVTVKAKALDVDETRKLADGVYVAVAEYAPGASGWSGVKWYVATPGPVLLTCHVNKAFSLQGAVRSSCAVRGALLQLCFIGPS